MQKHEDDIKNDTKWLEEDWRDKVKIADVYVEFKDEFLEILSHVEFMWDRHLGRIGFVKHWVELCPADPKPIYSAPYRSGQKGR